MITFIDVPCTSTASIRGRAGRGRRTVCRLGVFHAAQMLCLRQAPAMNWHGPIRFDSDPDPKQPLYFRLTTAAQERMTKPSSN